MILVRGVSQGIDQTLDYQYAFRPRLLAKAQLASVCALFACDLGTICVSCEEPSAGLIFQQSASHALVAWKTLNPLWCTLIKFLDDAVKGDKYLGTHVPPGDLLTASQISSHVHAYDADASLRESSDNIVIVIVVCCSERVVGTLMCAGLVRL